MNWKRLLPYLLLNIFISACVTSLILFWYDRTYRAASLPPILPQSSAAAPLNPGEQIPIEIVSVIGAGTLETEVVLIRYTGEESLDLTGWRLQDEDGNAYVFPQLTLYKNGAVQVHSASGTDTVVDLYWGHRQPVWQSGEIATLLDPQGNLRALYSIP